MIGWDRAKSAIVAFIRQIVSRYDYAAPYVHSVVAQNADGSLELRPMSPLLPGLSNVPIRYGVPGVSAKIRVGGRVLVRFENMDPSRPVATVWDAGAVDVLTLDTGAPNPLPVARMGDAVSIAFPPNMPVVYQVATPGPLGPLPGTPYPGLLTIANGASGYLTTAHPAVSA